MSIWVIGTGGEARASIENGMSADFFAWCWLFEDADDDVVEGRAISSSRISSSLVNPLVILSKNAASSISSSSIISGSNTVSRCE